MHTLYLDAVFRDQVALGARLGVLAEAIVMAAVLSAPTSPFRRANSLVHEDPDQYNAIVRDSFVSCLFPPLLFSFVRIDIAR